MELHDFLAKLDGVKSLPSGFSARCPAHEDHVSSLMVNAGKNQPIVVHCHAGCDTETVLKALGMSTTDLMGKPRCEKNYEYMDTDNRVLYTMQRWSNPKRFVVKEGKLPPPAERVLYQLPGIQWARSAGATIYVVEGEKDADRIVHMGLMATCNVGGAGSWLGHYSEQLADCHVIVVADNDVPGKLHARYVASSLQAYAASVALMVPRHGKDVSDLLDAGYTLDELDPLAETEDVSRYVAANVKTRKVEWAWPGYMALGKLSIIEGDPGDGKSVLTVDLAARWSNGQPMPDGSIHGGPWPVFMVSAEDDMEDTIVPRLIAAGARLDQVSLFPHGSTPEQPFQFGTDLPALERAILETGARIIFFDPLASFLSSSVDTHNDMQVRHALYPLAALAVRCRAAVIAVRHLNKGGGGTKAIYRGNGSIAFTGAARAGFLVASDPDNPQSRLLACVKTNLAQKPASMRYQILSSTEDIPYVEWGGSSEIDAQAALDGPKRQSEIDEEFEGRRRERQYEIEFLVDLLRDGPKPWKEIVQIGKSEGFSDRTLRRARADAGLVKIVGDAGNAGVLWGLRQQAFGHLATEGEALARAPHSSGQMAKSRSGDQLSLVDDGQMENEPASDADRDAAMETSPRACSVCGTDIDLVGYQKPLWEWRCIHHEPSEMELENGN